MKLWNEKKKLNQKIEDFTVGSDPIMDLRLVPYDCRASIAHARTLEKAGFLTREEVRELTEELRNIMAMHAKGRFRIKKEEEDCHTAIENHLVRKLGDTGRKIHTARSRNDQVLAALRLYYKEELTACLRLADGFTDALRVFIRKYGRIRLPGYTHTRKAMPSSIRLWWNAFGDAMNDNIRLLRFVLSLIDQCPLGSGAGYGVPVDLDRAFTAKELGFGKVQKNPIYVQNSRGKFEATILHALGQIMLDMNRMASDLILFSMPEFGYFELPDALCTGSSIMPHKKNPDVLELVRAYFQRIVSLELELRIRTANLTSGYHRDLQLTKEPVMKAFDITRETLEIMTLVTEQLRVNKDQCEKALTGEVFAAEEVYRLVQKGVPFRKAYIEISRKYR